MRRRLSLVLSVLITALHLLSITEVHADSAEILNAMMEKLKRGTINTFSGWLELPYQAIKGYKEGFMYDEDNKILGVTFGIVEGAVHSVGRTFSGITEMLSFWTAGPQDNEDAGIPLDADYAWEEGVPYDMFDPNFTDATIAPIVNKFLRGAGNAIFGFMEVPGQIMRGIRGEDIETAVLRGFWYWCSREISGISDIMTAPFPNPEYTVGVTFDEKWPWEAFTNVIEQPEEPQQETGASQ